MFDNEAGDDYDVVRDTGTEAAGAELQIIPGGAGPGTSTGTSTIASPRTDSILYTIVSSLRDENGLIVTGPTPVMSEYIWAGNLVAPAGALYTPGQGMAFASYGGSLSLDVDTNMVDNFSPGTMGIYVERFDGNEQYPATFASPREDYNIGLIRLYTPVLSDDVTPPYIFINEESSGMAITDEPYKMTAGVLYSNAEIIGLESKYGYLPTGATVESKIKEIFHNLAVELVLTYTSRGPAGHKITNYKTLTYSDFVTISDLEMQQVSNVEGSATLATGSAVTPLVSVPSGFAATSVVESGY